MHLRNGRGSHAVSTGFKFYPLLLIGIFAAALSAQTTWTTIASSGTDVELRSIVYADGQFVVVGDSGTIMTSANGTSWAKQTSGVNTDEELYSVAWGDNMFVAAGDSGVIVTSLNGTVWTKQTTGTTYQFHSVVWTGTQFFAVGGNGIMFTSPNGTTWTSQVSGTALDLWGIAYNGSTGLYVAVGGLGNQIILTSTNGTAWTGLTAPGTTVLYDVDWNGTVFTAVGDSGTIYTSTSGSTWTKQTTGTTGLLCDILWAGGQYVVIGHQGVGVFGPILSSTSSTGVTWTARTSSTTQWLYSVALAPNLYVAVGTDGAIITSPGPATGVVNVAPAAVKQEALRVNGSQASYSIAAKSHVSMKLFDVQGRLLSVLADADQTAGAYTRSIRPAGMNLPFGKYILSFKTAGTSLDRPVVLGQ